MNFSEGQLNLNQLRQTLIRLEDTIIFALIERAQFAQNNKIYQAGQFDFKDNFHGSFVEWMLYETEKLHGTTIEFDFNLSKKAKVRRFTSPDENPFSKAPLPDPILPSLSYPTMLHEPTKINLNQKLLEIYIKEIIPSLCKPGDDLQYGSSSTKDVSCLEALSRRIHYGKFIAEAKFSDAKYHDKYVELIKKRDSQGIYDLLTDAAVEQKLLKRLKNKALVYGQDISFDAGPLFDLQLDTKIEKIDTDLVVKLYQDFVIPLTKEVEVDYLLQRLEPVPERGDEIQGLLSTPK